MITQKMLLNIIIAVSLVGCLILEHYGIIPNGSEERVLLVMAGLASGSGSLVPSSNTPLFSGGGTKKMTVSDIQWSATEKPGSRG